MPVSVQQCARHYAARYVQAAVAIFVPHHHVSILLSVIQAYARLCQNHMWLYLVIMMIVMLCLQVALVAGTTFTVVEIFAAVLFLATRDDNNNGYSPSSKMVILHMFIRGNTCQLTEQFCVLLWMHIMLACMPAGCVSCNFAQIDKSKADATVKFIGVYLSCLGSKCLNGLPMHILGHSFVLFTQ